MTNYTDTQTRVNAVYRAAILETLAANPAGLDREELNEALLGGTEPPEVTRWVLEPYTPAMAQLVNDDEVCMFTEDRHDIPECVVFSLRSNCTRDQQVESDLHRESSMPDQDWNDPTNWRMTYNDAADEYANMISVECAQLLLRMKADQRFTEGEGGDQPKVFH